MYGTKRNNSDAWQIFATIVVGVTLGLLFPSWWIV